MEDLAAGVMVAVAAEGGLCGGAGDAVDKSWCGTAEELVEVGRGVKRDSRCGGWDMVFPPESGGKLGGWMVLERTGGGGGGG